MGEQYDRRALAAAAHLRPEQVGFGTRIFAFDPIALRDLLIIAACPVVCRGYLDGDEDWHQLCIDKADAAMKALEIADA